MRRVILFLVIIALNACAPSRQVANDYAVPAPALERIADNVWVHKSYKYIDAFGPVLSQGMVVKTDAGVFLVDTAWTDEDTKILLDLIVDATGETPKAAIVTHAHQDKMGGMAALAQRNVSVFLHEYTKEDALARGLMAAQPVSANSGQFGRRTIAEAFKYMWLDGDVLEAFYAGPGHTRDNITVYYAPAKILFGGCLIRPGGATDLGNVADADIAQWAGAVRKVAAEYPQATIIIPSHGPPAGRELLDHTIALADAAAVRQ